jgi:hypothetical protein
MPRDSERWLHFQSEIHRQKRWWVKLLVLGAAMGYVVYWVVIHYAAPTHY